MPEFAPVINVSTLNGTNGIRIDGEGESDLSGNTVGGAGDVNKDGYADLLIGAPYTSQLFDQGIAYLVFGAPNHNATSGLTGLIASDKAYRFVGEMEEDKFGFGLSSVGDVNGDGLTDFMLGAFDADPDSVGGDRGASYLIFGGAGKLDAADLADGLVDHNISMSFLTPQTGFRFDGAANDDYSGIVISGGGDINGDGVADLVIGAPGSDVGGSSNGSTYVVFGGLANLNDLDDDDGNADGRIDLTQISAGQGFRISGVGFKINQFSGTSVSVIGDYNGDGFDDVIIGSPNDDPNAGDTNEGTAYILFGRPTASFPATLDLSFNGANGTRLDGEVAGDQAGRLVSAAGDVNGDGLDDVIVGSAYAERYGGNNNGAVYVVFGRPLSAASFDLTKLDGSNGFRLDGFRDDALIGLSATAAGDVNGDGFSDLLIGSRFDLLDKPYAGAAFVVFGKAGGFAPVVNLASLDGNTGFSILGANGFDELGSGLLKPAGDINGDEFDDIVVGARYADNGGNNTGSTYVIYGHRANTAVTRLGTERDETINGGKEDDSLSGRSGNDKLIGWEGDDKLDGESGNDTLNGGKQDDVAVGGGGNDTFLASIGDDTAQGGSGIDTVDFISALNIAITANLATGLVDFTSLAGSIVTGNIERIFAGNAADVLIGNGRDNTFIGRAGNDSLDGGAGADTLTGGTGRDTLVGGADGDLYDYNSTTESAPAAASRDRIFGFTVNSDRIDLSTIDAIPGGGNDAFVFKDTLAFTAAGQVRVSQSGADTIVELNTVGTTGAEMSILLVGVTATSVHAVDFVL